MTERPARRVQFDAVETHEDLVDWSHRYCERAIAVHDVAVDLDVVEFTVSTRARRRAAAVKTPKVSNATVGDPIDWARWRADGDRNGGPADRDRNGRRTTNRTQRPPDCELSLSWAAFEEFDRGEWRDTLRHELVHVEQFQAYGTTDHGPAFRDRADELDAAVRCRRFADARYLLRCGDCESIVARRYRASKLVKRPEQYRSNCCQAPLSCVEQ